MTRLLSLLIVACICQAQTPDTAIIRGRVLDQSQAGVGGVHVEVVNSQTGQKRTAETGSAGDFSVSGLPISGRYNVIASKSGFAETAAKDITLIGDGTAEITLQLNIQPGKTQVSVTGVIGEVRADQPQLGDILSAVQIENTPILNRRITFLPLLNAANRPAINQGDVFMNQFLITTNGAGRRQTTFLVDGANGNDSWGRQTIITSLPLAAVQEMDVLTNAFSAEYGGSTGSVINIISKSGGQDFHGDVLELFRPSGPEAKLAGFTSTNAASGNDLTNDTLGQSAVSLSGPLGNLARFFFAGELSRQDRASPVISPVEPGNFVGHYRGVLIDFRLDRHLNENNNLFFRSGVDAFHDTNPNGIVGGNSLPNVARVFRKHTFSEELGETAVITPRLLNNVRLQFQLASPVTEFDPVIDSTQFVVPISTGGTFTSGTSQSALLINRQYEANDTLSASWGKNQVKFGFDVLYARNGGNSKEFGGPTYLGSFTFNTCTLALSVCESPTFLGNIANVKSYTQSYGNANYVVDDTLWALFIQDDFHVRPDLTFNFGLRYERQTFADSTKDFAPRVGFAWNVGGDGKTVIRGGFGIYYSQIVDNSQANYALTGPTGVFNYTATPGQIGFPTSISAAPLPAFPVGAIAPLRSLYIRPGESAYLNQFFPTSTLIGYQNGLYNPYSEQWTFGIERRIARGWVLSVDYVGSHTVRINRPLDVDAPSPFIRTAPGQTRTAQAANCTRPYWIYFYRQLGIACNPNATTNPQPPYSVIQSDVNDGFASYQALDVNLSHRFSSGFTMLASYTYSHAIDNVDPDIPSQNPNDANFTGKLERGNAIFDQRQRFVLSGFYVLPLKITFGGVATLASGLPYNYTTGTTNSGDTGATTDRPVINGVVVGRNTGRGRNIYDVAPFLERAFAFGERFRLIGRVEAFNVFNHANFVGYSGTYGNGAAPAAGFGQPLVGITNQLEPRSLQFSGRFVF